MNDVSFTDCNNVKLLVAICGINFCEILIYFLF